MSLVPHTVAVVGAGTMGLGIAQVCAMAGCPTRLFDARPSQVSAALNTIALQLSQSVEKKRITHQQEKDILSRIVPAGTLEELKADLVIEAATEKLEIKQQLFAALEEINQGKAILATNTSSLSIAQIASALKNPGRLVGFHFFNPADRMKLVEIVSGAATDTQCVEALRGFSLLLGKTAVMAKDSPGFIVNRVARHFYVESLKLLEENAAGVDGIDALLRSAGFKMGPFELMDLIGLDTNLAVTTSVYEGFARNPKFRPSALQQQLVQDGQLGRKTGYGFYDYSQNKESQLK